MAEAQRLIADKQAAEQLRRELERSIRAQIEAEMAQKAAQQKQVSDRAAQQGTTMFSFFLITVMNPPVPCHLKIHGRTSFLFFNTRPNSAVVNIIACSILSYACTAAQDAARAAEEEAARRREAELASLPENIRRERLQFLQAVPLICTLDLDTLAQLVGMFQEKQYEAGSYIIQQGDFAHEFFILYSGDCTVDRVCVCV